MSSSMWPAWGTRRKSNEYQQDVDWKSCQICKSSHNRVRFSSSLVELTRKHAGMPSRFRRIEIKDRLSRLRTFCDHLFVIQHPFCEGSFPRVTVANQGYIANHPGLIVTNKRMT